MNRITLDSDTGTGIQRGWGGGGGWRLFLPYLRRGSVTHIPFLPFPLSYVLPYQPFLPPPFTLWCCVIVGRGVRGRLVGEEEEDP